ncbi:Carotenoid oxygenase, partial [Cynara cardunculus var. scolymus]
MQAKTFNFIPLKPSSPAIKLRRPQAISFPDSVPRNISITIPTQEVSTSVQDEKVAAYWDYQFLFVSQRSETANPISLRICEGSIPANFPLGTYYLTGPGLFRDDHGSTVHPLDGHGYLRAFTIDGSKGEVTFMARYIETTAQTEEHDRETGKWRFTHRGPFSVLKNGKKIGNTKVMKNVANTSVLKWGDRLFCLWEGGAPYEIESGSLDTIGKFDLINGDDGSCRSDDGDAVVEGGGRLLDLAASILKPILYESLYAGVFKMPPKRLLSHYKIDSSRNRLLMIVRLQFQDGREERIQDPRTSNDPRLDQGEIGKSPLKLLLKCGFFMSEIRSNTKMVTETCRSRSKRVVVRINGSIFRKCSDTIGKVAIINQDFGGSNNKYVYAATSSGVRRELPHFPFDTVVKFDTVTNSTHTWSTSARRFIGEPIFVSNGNKEDDGYLLVVEYAVSKQQCYLVILDAKKIGETNAVVARLE